MYSVKFKSANPLIIALSSPNSKQFYLEGIILKLSNICKPSIICKTSIICKLSNICRLSNICNLRSLCVSAIFTIDSNYHSCSCGNLLVKEQSLERMKMATRKMKKKFKTLIKLVRHRGLWVMARTY